MSFQVQLGSKTFRHIKIDVLSVWTFVDSNLIKVPNTPV